MKKYLILLLITILTININGKTRVYTCYGQALDEMASAYLAYALLNIKNHDLLFLLLDDPNKKLSIMTKIEPDDDLRMIKTTKRPRPFTDENIDSIFQIIKAEFIKSDTVFRLVSYEALYSTKEQKDYDYLKRYQYRPFSSSDFQEAVKKSGAKTHDEKIKVLKEWIDNVMKQPIRVSTDPWKLL